MSFPEGNDPLYEGFAAVGYAFEEPGSGAGAGGVVRG